MSRVLDLGSSRSIAAWLLNVDGRLTLYFLSACVRLAHLPSKATISDLKMANAVLEQIQMEAKEGKALLKFVALPGEPILVNYFDAALGKAPAGTTMAPPAQRGEVHFITSAGVLKGKDLGVGGVSLE